MAIIWISLFWLGGIYFSTVIPVEMGTYIWLLPVSGGLFLFYIWRGRQALFLSLAVSAFCLGGWWGTMGRPVMDGTHIIFYRNASGESHLRGELITSPGDSKTKPLRLTNLSIEWGYKWQQVKGDIFIFSGVENRLQYGDELELWGRLVPPPEFDGYAYREELENQGIFALIYRPSFTMIKPGKTLLPGRVLYKVRQNMSNQLRDLISPPESDIMQAIVLGERPTLDPSLKAAFNISGLAHMLTVSGKNLTILSASLVMLIRRRSRPYWKGGGLLLIASLVTLYCFFTGASGTILRAACFNLLALIALRLRLPFDPLAALLLSAVVMTIWEPSLAFESGFQLSLSGMLGLVLYCRPLARFLTRQRLKLYRRFRSDLQRRQISTHLSRKNFVHTAFLYVEESTAATVAAQLCMFPLLAYYFKQISVIAPLTNLLALPFLPLLMLSGGLTAAGGLIQPWLGAMFSWPTWLLVGALVGLAKISAAIPLAALNLPQPSGQIVALFYILAAVYWLRGRRIWRFNQNKKSPPLW